MTKKPSFKSRLRQGSRKSRNVLIVLAALLVTSGLIRIGSSSGLAIARESDTQSAKAEMQSGTLVPITTSVELEPVVEALRQRESNLNSKEEKLNERISEFEQASAQREKKLKEIEMRVGEKLQELKKAEESLSATIVVAETAAEEDLVKLTAVYENMKPKSAAPTHLASYAHRCICGVCCCASVTSCTNSKRDAHGPSIFVGVWGHHGVGCGGQYS